MSAPSYSAAVKFARLDVDPTDFGNDEQNEAVGRATLDLFVAQLTPEERSMLQAAIDRANA